MLSENNLEGDPLEALARGFVEADARGLLQVGCAVGTLAAGRQGQAADDAALTPEGLSHQTEAVRSFV